MKYTADFETTTTEPASVWLWGICSIDNPEIFYYGETIESFFSKCYELKNPTLYFHNLKFDDAFILDYLLKNNWEWVQEKKDCTSRTFTTLISGEGQFYGTDIYFYKKGHHVKKITIFDSLKIINLPVKSVAKAFGLSMEKGEIDYKRHDKKCDVTAEEIYYLKKDVQIMAFALQEMFSEGFDKMTIGSCALSDYKKFIGENHFKKLFPQLTLETDAKIRSSYKGGFTFCNPQHQNEDIGKGIVLDVNSLYPSVMAFKPLPYDVPVEFSGQYEKNSDYPLYVQKLRCFFKLKENCIPTIQLKHSRIFSKTEYLTSSFNINTGIDEYTELNLCSPDLELFFKHYDVSCVEYCGGYMFKASTELFKNWVSKWAEKKIEASKAGNKGKRTIAKLVLNNLCGKFSTNPLTESKEPYFDEEEQKVKYKLCEYVLMNEDGEPYLKENGEPETTTKNIKDPVYIPVGAFVTAWARYITISASQSIHEKSISETGISRYLYSDTDSIHIIGTDYPDNIEIDDNELGKWKHESTFKKARFIQAKRYIEEEYINENETYLKITCAGMPEECYKYVTFDNFRIGTQYRGKLSPKTVSGGVILVDIPFKLNG